jgi:transposase-like protein
MTEDSKKGLGKVVQIDERRIHDHLGELVRGTVEETLNGLLDAEADALCGAQRYERSAERTDYRAGSYERRLHTKAGEVTLKMPKLRKQAFETAIIERYRRRESSIEESLIEMYLAGVSVRRVEDITESLHDYYPEAQWQRCTAHFYRNVFSHVPNAKVKEVARMLKAIHAQESLASAQIKAADIVAQLKQMRMSKAAGLVDEAIEQTLTYYRFPANHWVRIRTNNPMERIIREIRRRTRVVGAFPDGQSALMLCAARLRHIAGTKWGTRRYLNMQPLFETTLESTTA